MPGWMVDDDGMLRDHTEHCVTDAIKAGDGAAKVRELSDAVERLVRG